MSVCISFSPSGLFRWARCLSLDVYTSLRIPCLISALSFKERGSRRSEVEEEERQTLVKHERKEGRRRCCYGHSRILQTVRKHFSSCEEELPVCCGKVFSDKLQSKTKKKIAKTFLAASVFHFPLYQLLITSFGAFSNVHIRETMVMNKSRALTDCLNAHIINRASKGTL